MNCIQLEQGTLVPKISQIYYKLLLAKNIKIIYFSFQLGDILLECSVPQVAWYLGSPLNFYLEHSPFNDFSLL